MYFRLRSPHATSDYLFRFIFFVVLIAIIKALATEWPQYRGAGHDGISTDRIKLQWSGSETNPLWRGPLTNGIGSFSVAGGRAFTEVHRQVNGSEKEVCLALNITNGQELWAAVIDNNARYPDSGVGY